MSAQISARELAQSIFLGESCRCKEGHICTPHRKILDKIQDFGEQEFLRGAEAMRRKYIQECPPEWADELEKAELPKYAGGE